MNYLIFFSVIKLLREQRGTLSYSFSNLQHRAFVVMDTDLSGASDYVKYLADTLTKLTVSEFFKEFHYRFFTSEDPSFIPLFLELVTLPGDFVVHQSNLLEYGIVPSLTLRVVKNKFDKLGLIDANDYLLKEVYKEPLAHEFFLTPEAFRFCLLRAPRCGNKKNPYDYGRYFLLLEKVYSFYQTYRLSYLEKLTEADHVFIEQNMQKINNLEYRYSNQAEEAGMYELVQFIKTTNERMEQKLHEIQNEINKFRSSLSNVQDEICEIREIAENAGQY